MTPETRTIDLTALAMELSEAGWEVDQYNDCTFHHGRHGLFVNTTKGELMAYDEDDIQINLVDLVWQTALGIVQRHIAGSRS